MDADGVREEEADGRPDCPDRSPGRPSGHVPGLVLRPPEQGITAVEVVDRALAYRPIAL